MDTNKKPDTNESLSTASQPSAPVPPDTTNSPEADALSAELNSIESEAPTGALTTAEPSEASPTSPPATVESTPTVETIDTIEAETPTAAVEASPAADEDKVEESTEPPKEPLAAELEASIATSPETTPAAENPVIGLSLASANATKKRRKRTLVTASVVGVLLVAGGIAAWQLLGKKLETVQTATMTDTESKVVKLGVTVSLVDGTVQRQVAGGWQTLRVAELVGEGDSIRTAADGRTVLSFDDGSAVRLDASSTVRVDSLDPQNIQLTQLEGTAYSRVVPSERTFAVTVDDTKYTAQGTAFATVRSETERGVQVYQSAVKVDGVNDAVAEGKQYYKQNQVSALVSVVTDINLADLEKDSFIKWNIAEDKKVSAFKEKLGILAGVKSVYKESTDKPVETKSDDKDDESTAALKLNASAVTGGAALSWSTGDVKVPSGYKLLRSSTSRLPTFGSAESIYVSDPKTKSYKWASGKSGTFWYRVCVYQANTGKCTNYSNVIQLEVTAKKTETKPTPEKEVIPGTMKLTVERNGKLSWTYTGKAAYGYKLVAIKGSGNPVYPANSVAYFDAGATSGYISLEDKPAGKYMVSICAWTGGDSCLSYAPAVAYYNY